MAVKWKTSATFYVFCFIVCSNTLVNGIRVQSKRVKGAAKGELRHFTSQLQLTHFCSVQMNSEMKNKKNGRRASVRLLPMLHDRPLGLF